jgi:hypothetical protein
VEDGPLIEQPAVIPIAMKLKSSLEFMATTISRRKNSSVVLPRCFVCVGIRPSAWVASSKQPLFCKAAGEPTV